MAGGYWHDPQGIDGIVQVLRGMQRQIDEIRGAAGVKSAVLRGDLMTWETIDGEPIVQIGNLLFSNGNNGTGLMVMDPDDGSMIASMHRGEVSGTVQVFFGEPGFPIESLSVQCVDAFFGGVADPLANTVFRTQEFWLRECSSLDLQAGAVLIDATGDIDLDPDGDLRFFISTTTNPANLNQTSNNVRVVSSGRKYKADIQDAVVDSADVLSLRPRTWIDRGELERDPNYTKRTPGFIAEELDEHESLRQFVVYNDEGEPDSIHYDRLLVAVIPVVKEQRAEIDALKSTVASLAERLDALEAAK